MAGTPELNAAVGRLAALDDARRLGIDAPPGVRHEDHRWSLALIVAAQEDALVPRPCTLLSFDAHHDGLKPLCIDDLATLRTRMSVDGVIDICEAHLRRSDDDWIKAGMELGVIGDSVVLGACDDLPGADDPGALGEYRDHLGGTHRLERCSLPGSALDYQGQLADPGRRAECARLWDLLGWRNGSDGVGFSPPAEPHFLSLDLDCFVVRWRGYTFPWPEKVWQGEFLMPGREGWTGKTFFQKLVERAGVLDIALESECCGGRDHAEQVLANANNFLFEGGLLP